MLIGYGAKLAGGCTSGNGLSGTSMLSPASLAATADLLRDGDRGQLPDQGAVLMRRAPRRAGVGLVFGVVLSWSGMTSPDVIRSALLFEDSYLFLFFASAVATAAIGLALLRRAGRADRVELDAASLRSAATSSAA